ncbi:sulfotransferase 1 family member D1-like isoform X1 [Phyllobates terribilis]|uniref:sulfotransferase 1 family member D1-like isoform X1 n=2 Tax=Phyllobates terribilis TaxID=111132 RepID=UPI003CCA93A2
MHCAVTTYKFSVIQNNQIIRGGCSSRGEGVNNEVTWSAPALQAPPLLFSTVSPLTDECWECGCRRPQVADMGDRPPIKVVSGMPTLASFAENWENVQSFQARDEDLLIVTYPKSGTTWISEILDLMLHNGDVTKTQRGAIYERVPFLEYAVPDMPTGTEILNARESPRIIKSHLPVNVLPRSFWEKKCKIIYMARNPKDVLVSYYHFHRMALVHPDPGTFEEYLHTFIEGKVACGPWSDHVKGWWKIRHQKDILYLFYEDMLEDQDREIKKVMKFIEKDLPEDVLEKINQRTTFKAMKDNDMTNYRSIPSSVMDHNISPFMRKGVCGDWKFHLTVAQNELFDEYYKREMADTDLTFHFED